MSENPRVCKWKQSVSGRNPEGDIKKINFPCRFHEDLTFELCVQCLLGELFSVFYTQAMNIQKSGNMQEEIMAFLRNFTSEDSDMR